MAVSAVAMAQSAAAGTGGVSILGQGLFETGGNAFKFPGAADTNFDSIKIGNDNANAIGIGLGFFPFTDNVGATAKNNVAISKNQNSGEGAYTKYNVEQIELGNRNAMAIGFGAGVGPFASNSGAVAENNIKISTNQE